MSETGVREALSEEQTFEGKPGRSEGLRLAGTWRKGNLPVQRPRGWRL